MPLASAKQKMNCMTNTEGSKLWELLINELDQMINAKSIKLMTGLEINEPYCFTTCVKSLANLIGLSTKKDSSTST
jgi:hypothetical protein